MEPPCYSCQNWIERNCPPWEQFNDNPCPGWEPILVDTKQSKEVVL